MEHQQLPYTCRRCTSLPKFRGYNQLRAHLRAMHRIQALTDNDLSLYEVYPGSRYLDEERQNQIQRNQMQKRSQLQVQQQNQEMSSAASSAAQNTQNDMQIEGNVNQQLNEFRCDVVNSIQAGVKAALSEMMQQITPLIVKSVIQCQTVQQNENADGNVEENANQTAAIQQNKAFTDDAGNPSIVIEKETSQMTEQKAGKTPPPTKFDEQMPALIRIPNLFNTDNAGNTPIIIEKETSQMTEQNAGKTPPPTEFDDQMPAPVRIPNLFDTDNAGSSTDPPNEPPVATSTQIEVEKNIEPDKNQEQEIFRTKSDEELMSMDIPSEDSPSSTQMETELARTAVSTLLHTYPMLRFNIEWFKNIQQMESEGSRSVAIDQLINAVSMLKHY